MSDKEGSPRDPLTGKQVSSPVSTGGGGPLFQARTQALYLANMLTGLQTVQAVAGGRVRSVRFEARYAGAHTDDIYCEVDGIGGAGWRCFVQCKLSLEVLAGNAAFKDAFPAAWRDWHGQQAFRRERDVLSIATSNPAHKSVDAARHVCELARASHDLADLTLKLETERLKSAEVRDAWDVLKTASQGVLGSEYADDKLFSFLRCLRFDVHDVATEETQEIALFAGLLGTWCGQPERGNLIRGALTEYCLGMGTKPGTVTASSWRSSASADMQQVFDAGSVGAIGLAAAWHALCERAQRQLALVETKLPNGVRVDRLSLHAQVLQAEKGHQLVLVTGGPGVGKSGVMAGVAPILAERGPLFFFRGDELDAPTLDAALVAAGISGGVAALDTAMAAYPRLTLVLDSLEKALEYAKRGALEELLALAAKHDSVRVLITARSHALAPLQTNFLYRFSSCTTTVPPLGDGELNKAMSECGFSSDEVGEDRLRRVLKVPFYLRLAVLHRMAGRALQGGNDSELRKHLWTEGVAPSAAGAQGLSGRRRRVFDTVCFQRTERLSQFVDAPADLEAVEALVRDGILVRDPHGRVAPAHDVFEDWSLFFRVEREVADAEQDWKALFERLGTHSGLRRAFRAWATEQADSGQSDALSVLDHCVTSAEASSLWRDEAMIGLLRSNAAERLISRFEATLVKNGFALLKRMSHVLRVACKGPSPSRQPPWGDSEMAKEAQIRSSMTTPVGDSWQHVVVFVERHKEALPKEAWRWVESLLSDACIELKWFEKTQVALSTFNLADYFLSKFDDHWSRDDSLGKRYFKLYLKTLFNAPERAKVYLDGLIASVEDSEAGSRNFQAEQKLDFALDFLNVEAWAAALPRTVCSALLSMYIDKGERVPSRNGYFRHERGSYGFKQHGPSKFSPASPMSGPFRHLLNLRPAIGIAFIVELANSAASTYQANSESSVLVVAAEESPNGSEHLHTVEFWCAYRAIGSADDLLASALMALEERLLFDAARGAESVRPNLEWILDNGTSSLTTAVAVSILTAHPDLAPDLAFRVFKSKEFFFADRTRMTHEGQASFFIAGVGLTDEFKRMERTTSAGLEHRRVDLECLVLRMQVEQPELRERIFSVLDEHLRQSSALPEEEQDSTWRIALKRMDLRALRLGPPVGDGQHRALVIADLDEDLAEKSARANERMVQMNRKARLQLWTKSAIGRRKEDDISFATPRAVLDELEAVRAAESDDERRFHPARDHEVAAALVMTMLGQDNEVDAWAMGMLLDPKKLPVESEYESANVWQDIARAVVRLAAKRSDDSRVGPALARIAVNQHQSVRRALAEAIRANRSAVGVATVKAISLGMARYAQLVGAASEKDWTHRKESHGAARRLAERELRVRLSGGELPEPLLSGERLFNPMDWCAALCACGDVEDWAWMQSTANALYDLAGEPRRGSARREEFPYDARQEVAALLARELMRDGARGVLAQQKLHQLLDATPEFAAEVLHHVDAIAEVPHNRPPGRRFWQVWDGASGEVLRRPELRSGYHSSFEKPLRELLFVGDVGDRWKEGVYHLAVFDERPNFVAESLKEAGDTSVGLEACLTLMYGVGRQSSIPSALPALSDAIQSHGPEAFEIRNAEWNAETICRIAVHEHRASLLKSKPLRAATLSILDGLVEAGSSIGFLLRDYLATAAVQDA